MLNSKSTIITLILLIVLTASISHGAGDTIRFNPEEPKMKDIKMVGNMLDSYITNNDKANIKSILAYTQDRASKYALLVMIEFHQDLSMDKLQMMKEKSPQRWEKFQSYMNKALTWLSLSRKAENFLGSNLEKSLKKELGES